MLALALMTSCNLNRWDLEENEILNFEKTLATLDLSEQSKFGLRAADDNKIKLIASSDDVVYGYTLTEEGMFDSSVKISDGEQCSGSLTIRDTSYVIINEGANSAIYILSPDYEILKMQDQLEAYIDTAYNNIDSLVIRDLALVDTLPEILLTGYVTSVGSRISFAMGVDKALNPMWIQTHDFGGSGNSIDYVDDHSYAYTGSHGVQSFLILDDRYGAKYRRINTNRTSGYAYDNILASDGSIYVSGRAEYLLATYSFDKNLNEQSKTILSEEDVTYTDLFKNDAGQLIVSAATDTSLMLSELSLPDLAVQWCNRFSVTQSSISINATASSEIGYYIMSLQAATNGVYNPRLIKTDQEGATRISPFTPQCN